MGDRSWSPCVRRVISDHGQDNAHPVLSMVVKMVANPESIRIQRANADPGIFHQRAVEDVCQRNADRTETTILTATDLEQGGNSKPSSTAVRRTQNGDSTTGSDVLPTE